MEENKLEISICFILAYVSNTILNNINLDRGAEIVIIALSIVIMVKASIHGLRLLKMKEWITGISSGIIILSFIIIKALTTLSIILR